MPEIQNAAAHEACPATGPRLLFFSGGTALKDTAHELTRYTHNSVHLITPFDSGGSSAALRKAFGMPAVGDVRARIIALADDQWPGALETYSLFAYRLPKEAPLPLLRKELESLVNEKHPLLVRVPSPMKNTIAEHLRGFYQAMPPDFPLAGANIGNLILAAGYLMHDRRLGTVAGFYSRMLRAKGLVRPVVETSAHLAVRLQNGRVIVGQHKFTGKHSRGVESPIKDIWLTPHENSQDRAEVALTPRTAKIIKEAGAICYPIGSFYSSVVANLLPAGVGKAVASNPCPKIFVPNLGTDPELAGHSLEMQVNRLLGPLLADALGAEPKDMLTTILVDGNTGEYPGGLPEKEMQRLGIEIVKTPLVKPDKGPLADPQLLAGALVRVCK